MRQVIESGASPLVLLNVRPPWYFYPTKQSPPAQVPKFQWRVDTGTRPASSKVPMARGHRNASGKEDGRRSENVGDDFRPGLRGHFPSSVSEASEPCGLVGTFRSASGLPNSKIRRRSRNVRISNLVRGGFERPQFPQLAFSFGCVENLRYM